MKLIIALDYADIKPALALVEQLDPMQCALKVGLEMYTRFGSSWVKTLTEKGFKVFLDLKFHDIPNTVAQACKAAADLGVWMINVHTLGGVSMLAAAKCALDAYTHPPLLMGVTVLTSIHERELLALGITASLEETVVRLATRACDAGLDGVVCAASMTAMIKKQCGEKFLAVTPGIRLPEDEVHDQQQVLTPQRAIAAGSDYLVLGRSITQAYHPLERLTYILSLIA